MIKYQGNRASAEWRLLHAEALETLGRMRAESIDALVTDPPAGISFMGKTWDHNHGGRDDWIRAFAALFRECLRVLKPGAHGLVWALPRTSHWTATALEDAGFEIRDRVSAFFGTGFPKSLNLGDGRGTALKPACEDWWLIRKPLDGTVAETVLAHGTGALNVDGCRIVANGGSPAAARRMAARTSGVAPMSGKTANDSNTEGKIGRRGSPEVYMAERAGERLGRWPANVVLSHNEGCKLIGKRKIGKGDRHAATPGVAKPFDDGRGWNQHSMVRDGATAPDNYGEEEIDAYDCEPGCAVRMLDEQSGEPVSGFSAGFVGDEQSSVAMGRKTAMIRPETVYADRGGASRFFYCAKASKKDRNANGTVNNTHPTVKANKLMRYLCRLVTPPGGIVLDCFAGSGSTLIAALDEGFHTIGIEQNDEYVNIARARLGDKEENEPCP